MLRYPFALLSLVAAVAAVGLPTTWTGATVAQPAFECRCPGGCAGCPICHRSSCDDCACCDFGSAACGDGEAADCGDKACFAAGQSAGSGAAGQPAAEGCCFGGADCCDEGADCCVLHLPCCDPATGRACCVQSAAEN